ncbi:isopeptide-forming domain-containing fimbrial protein [Streptomyces sp. AC495_CC817]|uniref:DUF7927 domain-containing protein n=1 Tax=Streptomyces sp. AC495_CC817 TaxID=2823900 RepID=UPI001C255699|nr:isopeptide-forming domain-containing fimbrial protein [Streptomyces sp. AC495_CC817]
MGFFAVQKKRDLGADPGRSRGERWRRRLRKGLSGVIGAALVASSLAVAATTVSAAPAFAADPFQCTPGAIYVQNGPGVGTSEVREFSVTPTGGTLGTTSFGTGHSTNGLGISSGGRYAYTVTNTGSAKTLMTYDRQTETTTSKTFTLTTSVLRGAVHPGTGVYYFASSTNGTGPTATIRLFAWDPSVPAQDPVEVGALRPTTGSQPFGANGDMAFSASGQLVLVADQYIYAADIPAEVAASTDVIDAKQVHDMGAGTQGNGIAFGNLGHIFVSVSGGGNRIIEVDLARGVTLNTTSLGTFQPTDLASCTFPNTLSLKKDVPGGRSAATDQFGLRIVSPSGYQVAQTDAVTRGDEDGVQPDYAGPIFTNQGDSFDLSESASGTTDLSRYDTSLVCEQQNPDGSTTPIAVDGANRVVQPSGPLGTDVVCTFVNDLLVPGLDLKKTSDPASGIPAAAGQRITYTVEARNTGNTVLDPVEIADDLSGVLAHAEYQNDVKTLIDGTAVTSGAAAIAGDDLSWTGVLAPGQVITITYSVVVDEDAAGSQIANRVTASGTPPGPFEPIVPPAVVTENPVPGFVVGKTADPASGSVVEPGQVIEYTVTGRNTGATALDPASISDDLSGVLAHAGYNDDIATSIDGTPVTSGAASISGATLSWAGALQPGQTVTITYSVTVDDDASGEVLRNTASGTATPTAPNPEDPDGPSIPGEPIVPPTVTTEHPVIGSGFTVSKTADPVTGTAVDPGDTITYTITGTNTGDTVLDPATLVDDLSAALAHAEYNDDVRSSVGTATVDGGTLEWSGSLAPRGSVVITYSVTVDADAGGETLRNSVEGRATPRIPTDPTDPDSPTTPGTPLTPPREVTEHPVNEPGFAFSKSVDPASGTAVDPGQVLTYTLTGRNTGQTALDPVVITDDLSGVLEFATLDAAPVATVGGSTVAAPVVTGDELRWSGALAVGETVTITYSVTVGPDAAGEVLTNSATGAATPPGGSTITPPPGTTTTPVNAPGFSVSKSAAPASGTAVDPGSVITYTVTGVNTGETALDPVEITDDLSGVLRHAVYNDDAAATIGGVPASAPTLADGGLSWSGALAVGETVTITYSVTVKADAGGARIENVVVGTATPPGGVPPIETPPATTVHTVNEPGFEVLKTADPAAGARVDPGSVITYTVTGVNTGETALDPVSLVDDLSRVLAHADYNGDAVATIGGQPASAPVVDGDELSWSGALQIGERVTVTYSVTVHGDAGGETLANTVGGRAVPPGGEELTPPPATTEHPVGAPGFTFAKTADPASGTAVPTGGVITYTLTGVNTGETDLDVVTIGDDLTEVLAHATLTGDVVARIGDGEAAAPVVTGTSLSWSGSLAEGETVTITYSVKVKADAAGTTLRNIATASATPPGGETITPPPSATEHDVLTPLAITGGKLMPWVVVIGVLLLLGGAFLVAHRRRMTE